MANTYKLIILSPEREFYTGEVSELIVGSTEGAIGILANHMPLVTTLRPSISEITEKDGKKLKAFTSSGILEVKDNEVTMLCDACEWPEEIDKKRAEEASKRAEKRLDQKSGVDVKRAELALARALARMKV
ncbi:MAG TPA: F0F1 ATP synthase subunit epsilon [Clostridiaceae bacterium]|nr:F0F1 ATP synthase subunit epsilon [Clostridiaceae bacterium]